MQTKRIFLASSSELKEDRKEFEIFIYRKNKDWVDQGVFIELIVWEDFLDAVSNTRLQDEYNKAIRECDIFVMLFCTKVGQYTEEEFETAFGQFKATNKPFVFTYFKDAEISTGSAKRDLMSLWAFREKLDALGHFYTVYKNINDLKFHFSQQLDKLAASGFIELKWDKVEAAAPHGDTYQATLTDTSAIAQGPDVTAVGTGGMYVGGKNTPVTKPESQQEDVVHENEPAENLADGEQVDRNEPAASDGFWSRADDDLKQAFTWAASLAAAHLPIWDRPHVDNDRVDGAITQDQDLLDARKPALRFAKLLAAEKVAPPIALGLFGNWGSGKTFFMGLMRDRIEDLAKNGGSDYVRRVVQIDFNAWHYHDTNLWASLAMRIFEGLAEELAEKKKESEVEAKRKELHQKIRSSEARRNEADERRKQALDRRGQAAKQLESKQAQRQETQQESIRLRLMAAWRAVSKGESFKNLRSVAGALAKHFGIPAALERADDLVRLRRDIAATREQAFGLFTAVGHRFRDLGASARTTVWLVLAAGTALAFGWGIEDLATRLKLELPDFSATVIQIATMVSTAAAWCGRRVKEAQGVLDTLGSVEADLANAEKEVVVVAGGELEQLQKEIEVLDKEIHQAGEELSAAEREIAEATAEIDHINRGGLVYDFLQERRTAQSYVGQLGLISTIRQDLDNLRALLDDFGKRGKDPIQRIILYIDDLDRCHPDKVVEVLQAVHLLLAFPLFNVVVGVDARWLERSLRRQYVGKASGSRADRDDPFSPQDYLEKIFQIPYALSRIEELGFKNLIGGLIETRTEWTEKEKKKRALEEAAKAAKEAEEAEAEAKQRAEKKDEPEGEKKDGVEPKKENGVEARKKDGEDPAASKSAATRLYFEDHEETFIQLLYEFIDRPRLAKRFVNIYRLLRVRADDEGESATFAASSNSPEYRAALILLAIHVGHPTVAAKVVRAIERAAKNGTWLGVLDEIEKGTCDGVVCDARERSEIGGIRAKLTAIGGRVPTELQAYRLWAPRVACYSFDWHRADAVRRQST